MIFKDPYAPVLQAVRNLYGDITVEIRWSTTIRRRLFWGCWGFTTFDGQVPRIFLSAYLPVYHSTEILAHELAHVVAGLSAGHGPVWEMAFEAIHKEYYRISNG